MPNNLALIPGKWTDGYGNLPARYWNATSHRYEFMVDASGDNATMVCHDRNINSIVAQGDTVAFTLNVITGSVHDPGAVLQVTINGTVVWTQSIAAPGTWSFASDPLNELDEVEIRGLVSGGFALYDGEFTITPTGTYVDFPPDSGNHLLTPSAWESDSDNGPPEAWNGSAYVFPDTHANTAMFADHHNLTTDKWPSTVTNGKKMAFRLDNPVASPGATFQAIVNGGIVYSQDLGTVGSWEFTSDPLWAGDNAQTNVNATGTVNTFTLTPLGDTPAGCFWTDFINCVEDC